MKEIQIDRCLLCVSLRIAANASGRLIVCDINETYKLLVAKIQDVLKPFLMYFLYI